MLHYGGWLASSTAEVHKHIIRGFCSQQVILVALTKMELIMAGKSPRRQHRKIGGQHGKRGQCSEVGPLIQEKQGNGRRKREHGRKNYTRRKEAVHQRSSWSDSAEMKEEWPRVKVGKKGLGKSRRGDLTEVGKDTGLASPHQSSPQKPSLSLIPQVLFFVCKMHENTMWHAAKYTGTELPHISVL
jgi:hypothetical protein